MGNDLGAIAYHEAGHAVAALVLHRRFRHVTIEPDEDSGGHIAWSLGGPRVSELANSERRLRARIERGIIVTYAGPLAEARYTGRKNHVGARDDYKKALELATFVCDDMASAEALLASLHQRAAGLVDGNWQASCGGPDRSFNAVA